MKQKLDWVSCPLYPINELNPILLFHLILKVANRFLSGMQEMKAIKVSKQASDRVVFTSLDLI